MLLFVSPTRFAEKRAPQNRYVLQAQIEEKVNVIINFQDRCKKEAPAMNDLIPRGTRRMIDFKNYKQCSARYAYVCDTKIW